jgi:hypothetical protein
LFAFAACEPGEVPRGDGSTDGRADTYYASDTAPTDTAVADGSTDTAALIDAAADALTIDAFDAPVDSPAPDDVPPADVRDVLEPDIPAGTTTIDLHDVTLFDNPADLADWPVTTMITRVDFQPGGRDGVHVEFSLRDGTGSWPDVTPPGWDGPLQYTLGFVEYIDGQWYGSAAIQFWRGLDASGGNVALDVPTSGQCTAFGHDSTCQVAENWYYDGRWGALQQYQPATGEIIGVFVVAGNVRGVTDGSQSPARERSNVVLVRMPDATGASYTF